MLVSTRGRYALRVMIDLAEHNDGKYVALRDVASRQEISEKYTGRIAALLAKAGFVEGLPGKDGGYRLTRPPGSYTVGSVLRLTEGTLAPFSCLGGWARAHVKDRRAVPMWKEFSGAADDFFDGVTIFDLAKGNGDGGNFVI